MDGHSRPEILYTINCAERYMINPKYSGKFPLKIIGICLRIIREKGLMVNTTLVMKIY